ncbi:molecular chaperone Hsp31 and glyoxalase 3 [Agrobacterium tumefaciens]|uniref:Molecular chaperone Hsp31 and glyoxalase 3 n=1 Tax=Agrobacterium radiobacter TaxID=362 RepID=A0ABR6JDV4_AGRRD|nr:MULTISPECIES: glyoxalase III HchA [Agrobacterium tumefaciens complex]MBB4321192.1 molecular chaperone Hsp31 and glyoxalase 3 [Agrobacterium radiobacter]MBB4338232.1 molecular chaperone Hsp31 and glyoxalase 3 [Agrobacterium radiobacter]MBB4493120.1 molecular chaperone Hsp31 and glyoxalase 3 [Agrobacterium radiobacter]MBB4498393.1 molecular chaperone Hsp31 and glyoxalase 3 [Agrobacterium radiobacter]MBB4503908.1 molecular chaperone Hsp31 and glyoxalase 3 [Agrobacterium radiobacter]
MSILPISKDPQPDEAEFNAFFPSKFSLSQFTSAKSDLEGADYPKPYTGTGRILVIGTDERYLQMENGTLFSTGNHPIETLVPMYHLHKAGFEFDIATVSGNPVKFEFWAMPKDDKAITGLHETYLEQFQNPLKLSNVVAGLGPDSNYLAVFIPGGHGPLAGLPFSDDVGAVLRWALDHDRHIISICHGPAALLACTPKVDGGEFPFAGYTITAFPDAADRMTPEIGYMPGHLTWHFGEKLKALGVTIANTDPDKSTHLDRKLITGASPFAANNLGKLAAKTLLAGVTAG